LGSVAGRWCWRQRCQFLSDLPALEHGVVRFDAAGHAQAETAAQIIVSGQSYGGRVASLLAAEEGDGFAGLICFSYPLHRPGEPDWDVRSRHWSSIAVPVLFLSGESDPFADIDLLRRAIGERLPSATLVTYPKVGHGLKPVLGEALEQAASFCRALDEPSTTR
jgi:predicted alpha/beta-hydrolase family hydrolase